MSDIPAMQSPLVKIAAVAVIILAVTGIGVMTGVIPSSLSRNAAEDCANCGVVENVRLVELKGQGSGLGAVAGGIVGGVVGHQIGSGRGQDVATVAGAAGGAYAGHQIERNVKKTAHYRITVRMSDGSTRTLTQRSDPGVHAGDSVVIANGTVTRN